MWVYIHIQGASVHCEHTQTRTRLCAPCAGGEAAAAQAAAAAAAGLGYPPGAVVLLDA